jgi:hypothetical protein
MAPTSLVGEWHEFVTPRRDAVSGCWLISERVTDSRKNGRSSAQATTNDDARDGIAARYVGRRITHPFYISGKTLDHYLEFFPRGDLVEISFDSRRISILPTNDFRGEPVGNNDALDGFRRFAIAAPLEKNYLTTAADIGASTIYEPIKNMCGVGASTAYLRRLSLRV